MGLESEYEIPVLTTTVEKMVQWRGDSSIWPVTFGLACCAIEMMAMSLQPLRHRAFRRRGVSRQPRASRSDDRGRPRLSRKMAPALRRVYDQMPEPKWVISMGACASIGGVFDNYASSRAWIRSCPWTSTCRLPAAPESMIYGIVQLQQKISRQHLA